jgi:hypothetical protein
MSNDANALIMGNSIPSATFLEIGAVHEGTILGLDVKQAKKFGTQDLDFWPDGQPKMQAVVTLRTNERDAEIENDNGARRLYVGSKGMKDAIAAAVKKAGADGLAVGGTLGVKYVRNGEGKNASNPPKVYGAKYEPPPPAEDYQEAPEDLSEYSEEPF